MFLAINGVFLKLRPLHNLPEIVKQDRIMGEKQAPHIVMQHEREEQEKSS
jgi:hypothetical protein